MEKIYIKSEPLDHGPKEEHEKNSLDDIKVRLLVGSEIRF